MGNLHVINNSSNNNYYDRNRINLNRNKYTFKLQNHSQSVSIASVYFFIKALAYTNQVQVKTALKIIKEQVLLLKLKICIKDQKVTGGQTVCEGLDTKPNTKSMLAFLLKPVHCHLDYLAHKAFRD